MEVISVDDKSNNDQKKQDIQNNANNIRNVRNAADIAMASKHPYGVAAGAAIKGLDKVTRGKSSEFLGKRMSNLNKMSPQGRRIQNLSNKMSQSGASDKLAQAASMTNGKLGNPTNTQLKSNAAPTQTPKTEDIGTSNLKKSNSNRKSNLFNFKRKKNKKDKASGTSTSSSQTNNTTNSNDSSSDSSSDQLEDEKEKTAKRIKKIIIRNLIIIALPILLILFLVVGIVAIVGSIFPFLIPELGDDEKVFISEVGTENYEKEERYYEKLTSVSKKYTEQCGKDIDISFIHSSLIYLYYQTNYDDADYDKMSGMVDKIVEQIPDACNIDYSANTEFYNNLKNNQDFINYYQVLIDDGQTIEEILNNIFEISNDLDINIDDGDETFISEETIVNVNQSGQKVDIQYNKIPNKSQTVQTNDQNKAITFREYLAGSVYASINQNDLSNGAMIQALTITNTTKLLNGNTMSTKNQILSIQSGNNNYCSVKDGCSYNKNGDLVSGPGNKENNNNVYYGGKYYYKPPLTSTQINNIDTNVNAIYGNVLVGDTTNFDLDITKVSRISGSDYQDILKRAYPNYTISNISENNYAKDLDYGARKVQTNVLFYDQKDYNNHMFCHRTGSLKNNSIGYAGCGVTAMAIVASTYKNSRTYDPIYMSERAYQTGNCGSDNGTYSGFYCKQSRAMGFKCSQVGKKTSEKQFVLNHLAKGHLVIIHVGSGIFTKSGHYMVLSGIDPTTKKVYVTDPNNRSNKKNRNTGSGWYSFNSIAKQVKNGFFVIWKG